MSAQMKTKVKRSETASGPRGTKHGWIWTTIFGVISLIWISPLLIVLLNSFKRKAFILNYSPLCVEYG